MLLFLFRYSSLSGTDKLDGIVDDTSMSIPYNNAILTRASLKIIIITLRKYFLVSVYVWFTFAYGLI